MHAARAERQPHRELAPAGRGPRELKARDVRARDDQEQQHRGKERNHEPPGAAEQRLLDGLQPHAPLPVVGRVLLLEDGGHAVQIFLSARHRDPVFETAEGAQPA